MIAVVSAAAVFAIWFATTERGEFEQKPAAKHEIATPSATGGSVVAPVRQAVSRPFAGRGPDPRFMRLPPPQLAVELSKESQRMILAMQNTYRCLQCAGVNALPRVLPDPEEAEYKSKTPEEFAAALVKSLGALSDACYVTSVLGKITDPSTPQPLLEIYYEDLLKRPNPVKLRTLFIIAGIEAHPLAERSREELQQLLRTDYQKEWPRWEQAVVAQVSREERGMRSASCRMH